MRHRTLFKAMAFLFLVALGGTRLSAQVIDYLDGHDAVLNSPFGSDSWYAQPFTTGTHPGGYTFTSAELVLSGTTANYSVSLYSNGLNAPGISQSALTPSGALQSSFANLTFSPSGNAFLAPSSTYWLVMTAATPNATSGNPYVEFAANETPARYAGGWSVPSSIYTSPNGTSWSLGAAPVRFIISADTLAVPEPSAYLLVGLGLVALLFVRVGRPA